MNKKARPSKLQWPKIDTAIINWTGDGRPRSVQFEDIYSSLDGLEESRYVFLQQNRLKERWLQYPSNACFTIAELGFGAGMNFLATWDLWLSLPKNNRPLLNFISFERYPLKKADLIQILRRTSASVCRR